MAEFIGEITPKDLEEMDNKNSVPSSPRGNTQDLGPTMADQTDDEVIIKEQNAQELLDNGEMPPQAKDPMEEDPRDHDGDYRIRSPPSPARVTSPPRRRLLPISPRGPEMGYHFASDFDKDRKL